MDWHCCACHQNFKGPTDRRPKSGCTHCHSNNIFDINIGPLKKTDFPFNVRDVDGTTRTVKKEADIING